MSIVNRDSDVTFQLLSHSSGLSAEVVAAVDVNTTANEVYKHNFPDVYLWPKTIEGITANEFNSLDFDMILMSPPCQPFTRIGLQGDISDKRTQSFLHILDVLPRLNKLPKYILLENVKGFESSCARNALVETLKRCSYRYQEFLLSPTCLGIPNSRLRYFLIAKAEPEVFIFKTTDQVLEVIPCPDVVSPSKEGEPPTVSDDKSSEPGRQSHEGKSFLFKMETTEHLARKQSQDSDASVLLRYAMLMDIVTPVCRRSGCFTKGYGHYVEGTGSVLQSSPDVEMAAVFKSLDSLSDEEKVRRLLKLRLRYFTPREIANLHGFPAHFCFPQKTTLKQRYRLLGNSLNVRLVGRLIQLMVE
uniref:tRNA (cytosine(38)-C(5))-methyltransferase n=1 Tax=Erpetoichthys calabaricus TaxID=27687 RepID=A0A8C4RUS6_ERPCA